MYRVLKKPKHCVKNGNLKIFLHKKPKYFIYIVKFPKNKGNILFKNILQFSVKKYIHTI